MSGPDCTRCPSLMAEHKAAEVFGQNVGAPVCRSFGHVIGRPDLPASQNSAIQVVFATKCPKFGEPEPLTNPTVPTARVASIDAEAVQRGPEVDPNNRPTTCMGCKHFVPESVVHQDFGWTAGLCAAQGRLIFRSRIAIEASGCMFGENGPHRDTTEGITLLDEYDEASTLGITIGATLGAHVTPFGDVDPREYPTDAPVSDDDKNYGIRAWREVTDPEGHGEPVLLPVFDYDRYIDELERNTVPVTGDDEMPELYVDHAGLLYQVAATMHELEYTPAFVGDAGVGKTEFGRWMAWLSVMPFERVSVRSSTSYDELFGTWLFNAGETRFREGRLPRAWRRDIMLLLDEPNTAEPEVWQSIRALTDNSKQLVLDTAAIPHPETGELIVPPAIDRGTFTYLMMAMNPAWDPKYTGVETLSTADQSRLIPIEMTFPPEDVERDILVRRYMRDTDGKPPSVKVLDEVMGIARDLRAHAREGTLPISWGIREQIKVIRMARFFKLPLAYKRAIADFLEPETRKVIMDVVESHVA